MSDPVAAHVRVRGRVQGVGFRFSTLAKAQTLGVHGWVRNVPSGDVEVHVQGEPGAVDRLVAWLRVGPRAATVTDVVVAAAEPDPRVDTFRIR